MESDSEVPTRDDGNFGTKAATSLLFTGYNLYARKGAMLGSLLHMRRAGPRSPAFHRIRPSPRSLSAALAPHETAQGAIDPTTPRVECVSPL